MRVIGALAEELGAQALFPFGTQPPHPFYTWALASGRVWSSPVQFLVGADAGLWASYRGALGLGRGIGAFARGRETLRRLRAALCDRLPCGRADPGRI